MADSKNLCNFAADFKQIARDDGLHLGKKPAFCSRFAPSLQSLSKDCTFKVDPLAQSVEHNTFNVGVLGSSPKRTYISNAPLLHHLAPTTRFYKLAYITRNGSLTLIRGVPATLCPSSLDNMIALDDLEPQDIFLICLQNYSFLGK